MCTYNGAKYVGQQLDSMLKQELPVDEIVICDDGSTDDTIAIVNGYAERHPGLFRVHTNPVNLGVCANFDQAIHMCSGDVIFLADQDDLWAPEKTRSICRYFEKHPRKEVVFTNARLIDPDNKPLDSWPKTLFDSVNFNWNARLWFNLGFELDILLKACRATGATMALRSSFLPRLVIEHHPVVKDGLALHDNILAFSASEGRRLGYIKDCLTNYRCHPKQQVGANFLYRYSNNIFSSVCFYCLEMTRSSQGASDWVKERCAFLQSRVDDRTNPKLVLRKFRLYPSHYRLLALPVWTYDMAKAITRSIRG